MYLVMHIYHTNHAHIHSAVQNLQHAINKLQQADREAYIAEAIRTCHEHTENGIQPDLLRLVCSPSEAEAYSCIKQAVNEVKCALTDMESIEAHYQQPKDVFHLGLQK
jgi:hypothetical protein